MKRSKMIQIIGNFLYELNVDHEECDELSDELLKIIEDKGMLPPATVVEMGGQIYQDNCWDKENSDEDTSTTDN